MQLRSSDYKNHRIFTLRCLHKELVPVSIRLKTTLTTAKARQIIRKAEKDLLQASVKAINNILDQVAQQTEDCRIQLASIISAERLRECQDFITKVSETRFIKVRQRQLNKFNILINKKQGNITRANATIWSNNLGTQSGREASASPPGEGNNTTQTNSQAGTPLPSREASSPSQAITPVSSRVSGIPPNSTLAMAHLPSGEGSNSLPAAANLPLGEGSSSSQAIAHLPSGEGGNSSQATALLPSSEGSSSSQAIAHLPSGEGSNSSQATALLSSSKGNSIPQATNSPQAGQISNSTR